MQNKIFESKTKALTAKEIILSMCDGLENAPHRVEMNTFGKVKYGVCFGCAATATICRIGGYTQRDLLLSSGRFSGTIDRKKLTGGDLVHKFEDAIEELRTGDVEGYNWYARAWGFAQIHLPEGFELPYLYTHNWREGLPKYRELAELQ